jgi:U6 snRNA-associated Sm-like protein LSm1
LFCAANFVLEDTFERHVVENKFGDIPLGLYIIRGENVVLLGEIVSLCSCLALHSRPSASSILIFQDEQKQASQTLLSEVSMQEILELEQAKAAEEGADSKPKENLWDFDKL